MATGTQLRGSGPEADDKHGRKPLISVGNGSNATRRRRVGRNRSGAAPAFQSPIPSPSSQAPQSSGNASPGYNGPKLGVPGTVDGPPVKNTSNSGDQGGGSQGGDEPSLSPMARDVRNQEIAAGRGKPQDESNAPDQNGKSGLNTPLSQGGNPKAAAATAAGAKSGDSSDTRQSLKNKEKDNLFKPDGDKGGGRMKGMMKGVRKKYAIAAMLAGTVGGGGGFALLGAVTGPLQFIHAAQLLQGFHLDEKFDQSDARMLAMARNVRYFMAGSPERTRMGYLSNKFTDRIEGRFNNTGFDASDRSKLGVQRGYVIDPQKVAGGDFEKLRGTTAVELQQFLDTEMKITSTIVDGKVVVDTMQPGYGYRKNKKLTRVMAQVAGYSKVTGSVSARFMGIRSGISWKPISKLDRKVLNTAEKRFNAWRDKRKANVSRGAGPVRVGTQTRANQNGEVDGESRGLAGDIEDLATEANVGDDEGKLAKFRADIRTKIGGGVVGIASILCILQLITDKIDEINFQNIDQPSKRNGMMTVTTGNQVMANHPDLDGETEQLGWFSELMYSQVEKDSWFGAMSVNAELGKGLVGKEIPESAKGVTPNWLGQILEQIPGLREVCGILTSTAGIIVLSIIGIALGPISFVITSVATFLLLPYAIDYIVDRFTGKEIDPMVAGPDKGNIDNYGVLRAAGDISSSWGGLPATPAQSAAVSQITDDAALEEFQQKGLAYRLFNPNDPKTLFARVIDSQTPDPATNMSRTATGLLNLGRSFGSMLTKPFFAAVGAAPLTAYDYGIPNITFTVWEMDDPRYEAPFENATRVAGLLDAPAGQEYIQRAKTCFGVTIEKKALADPDAPGNTNQLWGIQYPIEGSTPRKDVIFKPENKCFGADPAGNPLPQPVDENSPAELNWTDVRFFIFDTQVTNGMACYEGDKQACIDAGMEPAAGAI